MLNVPKTVRFRFGLLRYGGFFWLRKEHYDISMRGGYFISKIRSTAQQPLLQQQVPVAVIKF
jgi:hypothetical protein